MQQELVSNIPEWSVSELSGALKRTLEDQFGHVRLRGEISGYRGPHGSGHVYFSIKDASAKIDALEKACQISGTIEVHSVSWHVVLDGFI